jgi:hypothetical protein
VSHNYHHVPIVIALLFLAAPRTGAANYSFEDGRQFIKTYCASCHLGKSPAGGFNVSRLDSAETLGADQNAWNKVVARVRGGQMPPKGASAPNLDEREVFVRWAQESLRAEACPAGPVPGPAPVRRLSRSQYSATVRDLLNLHLDAGGALPADGAGGEGFDNAAETCSCRPYTPRNIWTPLNRRSRPRLRIRAPELSF